MKPDLKEMEAYALLLRNASEGIIRNIAFIRANADAEHGENYNEIWQYANSAQTAAEKIAVEIPANTEEKIIGF